jgi:protein phosphatase
MINYTFCMRTDAGRVRDNNEDSAAFDEATQLAILADGMGGHNAGEVASHMAIRSIESGLVQWLSEAAEHVTIDEIRRAVEFQVVSANQSILAASQANPDYSGMGTTLVLAVFHGNRLIVGHVGDSRCYRLRGRQISLMTKDHSLLQEQLEAGLLSAYQAAASPMKNMVTRALGVEVPVLLDLAEHEVAAGDVYLLCSDGLSDMVDDAQIGQILQINPTIDRMADDLVFKANNAGGLDNITVLLIQATGSRDGQRLISQTHPKQ